jgi:N-methylhydantoinase B/oxoprolinase/acetone carboxylase alpha subunit
MEDKNPEVTNMGIGYQGMTLAQMVEEKKRFYAETGCLYTDTLRLHQSDLPKMMAFNFKLREMAILAREQAKLITASPLVRSFGECQMMVATPEGDAVAASEGLIGQIACVPKHVEVFAASEDDPGSGIQEGDVFEAADSWDGNMHSGDIFTYIPVFYKGELVAWACGMNHVSDNGAPLAPGSLQKVSVNAFSDGWFFPPALVGKNFVPAKWWEEMYRRHTRTPLLQIMDVRMRVTAAKLIHDQTLELIEEFGIEYFRQGMREIYERERRSALEAYKDTLVPGFYQGWVYDTVMFEGKFTGLYAPADRNWYIFIPYEVKVQSNGRLHIDFEGLTREGNHTFHGTEPAVRFVAMANSLHCLLHTETINCAADYLLDINIPEGSCWHPTSLERSRIYPSGSQGVHTVSAYIRSLFARGILEECCQLGTTGNGAIGVEGVFDDGKPWAMTIYGEVSCNSPAARPYKDGVEHCGCSFNPQADATEYEEMESFMPPIVLIGRSIIPDTAAPGKFNGATANGLVFAVVDGGQVTRVEYGIAQGKSGTSGGAGYNGGYPGAAHWALVLRNTNILQLMKEEHDYPHSLEEVRIWIDDGRLVAGSMEVIGFGQGGPYDVKDGDMIVVSVHATQSWGDPLERDLHLIEADLERGFCTSEAVPETHGVVVNEDNGHFKSDATATKKLRAEMKQDRLERSVPFKEWWGAQRHRIESKDLPDFVRKGYEDTLCFDGFRERFLSMWQLPDSFEL